MALSDKPLSTEAHDSCPTWEEESVSQEGSQEEEGGDGDSRAFFGEGGSGDLSPPEDIRKKHSICKNLVYFSVIYNSFHNCSNTFSTVAITFSNADHCCYHY